MQLLRIPFLRLTAAAGAALAAMTIVPPARAELAIGAEASPDFVFTNGVNSDHSHGFGFAARVGYKLPIPVLRITLEGKLAYDRFSFAAGGEDSFRAMAGGRVGINIAVIAPTVFGHYGVGHLESNTGQAFDVGLGVDFTPIPVIDLGIFLSYNRVAQDPGNVNWLSVGAQVGVAF